MKHFLCGLFGCLIPLAACASGYTDDFHLGNSAQYTVFSNNTGGGNNGRFLAQDTWMPPSGAHWNFYNYQYLPSIGLSGRTASVADQWSSSNFINQITASTSAAMANSHTIGYNAVITIPAGLGDGTGGAFVNGLPTNANYQEIGAYDATLLVLSPGHLVEGVGIQIQDNSGAEGVAAPLTGFQMGMVKNAASNTYPSYAYHAYSLGTQQATYAPTAAFRVDGGWQKGIDLSGMTGGVPIVLPNGPVTLGPPDSGGLGYRILRVPN